MKSTALHRPFGAILLISISSSAFAGNGKAEEMVAGLVRDQAALLANFPAFVSIDRAIRSDCAAKNKGQLATDSFCGCASALTMSLWRSGADPNMLPRLNEYLKNPSETAANGFLQYQGPELYSGFCDEATKR